MAERNKQPEIELKLRYAETEHLLKGLEALPDDLKKSVTHTDLHRQLTIIRDYWLKEERARKARQKMVIQQKTKRS